jgi:hypothetical protein
MKRLHLLFRAFAAVALASALVVAAVVATVAVPSILTGCQTNGGGDQFVIEAEKDLRSTFHIVDAFLEYEASNRRTVGPDVTAVADAMRRDFPPAYKAARDSLRAYKENRDPQGRANVSTWLKTLNAAMLSALRALPQQEAAAALNRSNPTP